MNKRREKHNFATEYDRLCSLQTTCPLPLITSRLNDNIIDFNADRMGVREWDPFLGALRVNKSLKMLAIRSIKQPSLDVRKVKRKLPLVRSREYTLKLSKTLKDCLALSACLECIILHDIPFRTNDLTFLSKGVEESRKLIHLSLERCRIGDNSFKVLAGSLRKSNHLVSVDFTDCALTWKSAEQFASIIKHQGTCRHGEAWKESLRYRTPNLDQMHGLRRITLNENNIGDMGARLLADALKDDLWLKALDIQQCSISMEGARIMKHCISTNKTLLVLDMRKNPLIEYEMLRAIMEQVMINAGGEDPQYQWLTQQNDKKQSKRNVRINRSFQGKCTRNKTRDNQPWKKVYRQKLNNYVGETAVNTFETRLTKPTKPSTTVTKDQRSKPLEHFTASEYFSLDRLRDSQAANLPTKKIESSTSNRLSKLKKSSAKFCKVRESSTANNRESLEKLTRESSDKLANLRESVQQLSFLGESSQQHLEEESPCNNVRNPPSDKLRLEFYKEKYKREKSLRVIAVAKANQLEEERRKLLDENEQLKQELLVATKPFSNKSSFVNLLGDKSLNDENVLESIEASFQEFQKFLDKLSELGLGDLYANLQQRPPEN